MASDGPILITLDDESNEPQAIRWDGVPSGIKVTPDPSAPSKVTVQISGDRLALEVRGKEIIWTNSEASRRPYQFVDVPEVLYLMKRAGFEKIYLPLETVKASTNKRWNRAWNRLPNFEKLLEKLIAVGYSPRQQDINAFVMFGLPGEDIEEIVDTALYASARVGSVIPMLFTPVPSTPAFVEYEDVIRERQYDLHHLNGKLFPFLPELKSANDARGRASLTIEDYLRLEAFMQRRNAKVMGKTFDILNENSRVAGVFREVYSSWKPRVHGVLTRTEASAVEEDLEPTTEDI